MKRAPILAFLLLLTACSVAPLTIPVADIVLLPANTGNLVCYVPITESAPVRFTSASYLANATYTNTGAVASDDIEIVFFGRSDAPAQDCVEETAPGSIKLSDPIRLAEGETQAVIVGVGEYGTELANLITDDQYWIGAKVSDNYALGGEERIELTNGRLQVQF